MPRRLLLLFLSLVLSSPAVLAQRGHSASRSTSTHSSKGSKDSSDKTVHVRSYTRKDGTVVRAYDRRPAGTKATETPAVEERRTSTAATAPLTPPAHDSRGRIKRSEEAKRDFERQTGYPHGRPGYVVDHIKPLACGGADDASNMQWQTVAEAKAKDKTERIGCK